MINKKICLHISKSSKIKFFVIFCLGLGSNSKQQAPMKEVSFKTKCFIKIKRMKSLNESHRNFCYIKFYENSTGRQRTIHRYVKTNPRIFIKKVTGLIIREDVRNFTLGGQALIRILKNYENNNFCPLSGEILGGRSPTLPTRQRPP